MKQSGRRMCSRAQDEAEYLIEVRAKIGSLMAKVPKASGGDRRSENFKNDNAVVFEKPKTEVIRNLVETKADTISELGFTPWQARELQAITKNPDAVQAVIEEARGNASIKQTRVYHRDYEKQLDILNNDRHQSGHKRREKVPALYAYTKQSGAIVHDDYCKNRQRTAAAIAVLRAWLNKYPQSTLKRVKGYYRTLYGILIYLCI